MPALTTALSRPSPLRYPDPHHCAVPTLTTAVSRPPPLQYPGPHHCSVPTLTTALSRPSPLRYPGPHHWAIPALTTALSRPSPLPYHGSHHCAPHIKNYFVSLRCLSQPAQAAHFYKQHHFEVQLAVCDSCTTQVTEPQGHTSLT